MREHHIFGVIYDLGANLCRSLVIFFWYPNFHSLINALYVNPFNTKRILIHNIYPKVSNSLFFTINFSHNFLLLFDATPDSHFLRILCSWLMNHKLIYLSYLNNNSNPFTRWSGSSNGKNRKFCYLNVRYVFYFKLLTLLLITIMNILFL
jgi:hypothetical protein